MSVFEAIVLAVIEGLTEYLPVSSTGHMIIASSVFGIADQAFTKLFTVAIQFGTILSVLALYWRRFLQSVDFYKKLFVAFLPAVFLGLIFSDLIDQLLESPLVVAISLILGGFVLLKVDEWFKASKDEKITYLIALKIGFYQCIAMIPGVSRSGASIVGGMSQHLSRTTAAEFSFFLAVPTMFGAALKKSYDYYQAGFVLNSEQINLLIIGNVIGFLVAILAIKSFIGYLSKHGFKMFGYYRIAFGILILLFHFFVEPLTV